MTVTHDAAALFDSAGRLPAGRRSFLRTAGLLGLGAAGAAAAGTVMSTSAFAATDPDLTDVDILNFALNLEYLEAEYYQRAVTGNGLDNPDIEARGLDQQPGVVTGGRQVDFGSGSIGRYAAEIANDELSHVRFLRAALEDAGAPVVARPAINLREAFATAASAAGLGDTFDPYSSPENFLLGAFVFEDVGVTAFGGAAKFIQNKDFLTPAAGILAVEAYHAGIVRSQLYRLGLGKQANAISDARDKLDGASEMDEGVLSTKVPARADRANIVPTDENSLTYRRSPEQVLSIVYLSGDATKTGGFLPSGANPAT